MGRIIGLRELYRRELNNANTSDLGREQFFKKTEDLFEMVLPVDINLDARWPEEYRKEIDKMLREAGKHILNSQQERR